MSHRSALDGILDVWDWAEAGCAVVALLLIGGPFLAGGVFLGWRSASLAGKALKLQAQVINHEERIDKDSKSVSYWPVVRFTAPDGRNIEFTAAVGSIRREPAAGDTVPVLYDPGSGSAEIRSFKNLWLFPLACSAVGTLLVGLAVVVMFLGFGYWPEG